MSLCPTQRYQKQRGAGNAAAKPTQIFKTPESVWSEDAKAGDAQRRGSHLVQDLYVRCLSCRNTPPRQAEAVLGIRGYADDVTV